MLIVDDETEMRHMLREILEGDGHRIATAGSGREALERMSTETYDVILTDLRMPDLDGQSLYREIAERWPGQAAGVVFITGDTLAPALRELAGENGRPVIEKPFLPSEVRRVIAEVMASRKAPPRHLSADTGQRELRAPRRRRAWGSKLNQRSRGPAGSTRGLRGL